MGLFMLVLHAGGGAYSFLEWDQYLSTLSDYDDLVERYQSMTDPAQVRSLGQLMELKYVEVQDNHTKVKTALLALAGVYLFNILDAVVFMPRLPWRNPSGTLTPDIRIRSQRGTLTLNVRFRF